MKNCTGCHSAHVKCTIIGDSTSCVRCTKMHVQCTFRASLRANVLPPPPLCATSSLSPPLPPPPTPNCPTWTHTFFAHTNSSDRVRAASVAYLLPKHPNDDSNRSARLGNVYSKKAAKQEKFLSVIKHANICAHLLTTNEIREDVIVFDGTASHPLPLITPPRM